MRPIGYLVNTKEGPIGGGGLFYDYILASNGVFVRAGTPLLSAMVRIAEAEVRGLLPLEQRVEFIGGRIPRALHDLTLGILASDPHRERYLAVAWEGGQYRLRLPEQEPSPGGVSYERLPSTILDIHSHGALGAFFSGTDDRDEQGLRLSLVVGRLDTLAPEVALRVGVYGYFASLAFEEVFAV